MRRNNWKVGELARLTGLSIRTLHYYDEVGLLKPSQHTEAGYRLYSHDDVVRLCEIKSLRELGFSIGEVERCLVDPQFSPLHVIRLHLARLQEQMAAQQRLYDRLEAVAKQLEAQRHPSSSSFLEIIKEIQMIEKYYTSEQLTELEERRKAVGEERIREVEAEWPRLMNEVRVAMENGVEPTGSQAQTLAKRWHDLVEEFTGGNDSIRDSLNRMYEEESTVAGMDLGPMREMMAYIAQANEARLKAKENSTDSAK